MFLPVDLVKGLNEFGLDILIKKKGCKWQVVIQSEACGEAIVTNEFDKKPTSILVKEILVSIMAIMRFTAKHMRAWEEITKVYEGIDKSNPN